MDCGLAGARVGGEGAEQKAGPLDHGEWLGHEMCNAFFQASLFPLQTNISHAPSEIYQTCGCWEPV